MSGFVDARLRRLGHQPAGLRLVRGRLGTVGLAQRDRAGDRRDHQQDCGHRRAAVRRRRRCRCWRVWSASNAIRLAATNSRSAFVNRSGDDSSIGQRVGQPGAAEQVTRHRGRWLPTPSTRVRCGRRNAARCGPRRAIPEAGPRGEECLVGDLDGRFARRCVAIEDQQATLPEPLDRLRSGFSIVVRSGARSCELGGGCRRRRRRRSRAVRRCAASQRGLPVRGRRRSVRRVGRPRLATRPTTGRPRWVRTGPSRRSNSSVSMYCTSGSAAGWPSASRITSSISARFDDHTGARGGTGDRQLHRVGRHRTDRDGVGVEQRGQALVAERPVEEVGAQRDDHVQLTSDPTRSDTAVETPSMNLSATSDGALRVELLELIDDDQQVRLGADGAPDRRGGCRRVRCRAARPGSGSGFTATWSSAASSSSNGSDPGTMVVMNHRSAPGRSPRRSAGSTPALTSDDFPAPDGPTAAAKRPSARVSSICRIRSSRPKKSSESAMANGTQTLVRVGERASKRRLPLRLVRAVSPVRSCAVSRPAATVNASTNSPTSAYRSAGSSCGGARSGTSTWAGISCSNRVQRGSQHCSHRLTSRAKRCGAGARQQLPRRSRRGRTRRCSGRPGAPASCSGAAYPIEPVEWVDPTPAPWTAIPKSLKMALSSLSSRMFDGFTSRWMTPARWATIRAPPICSTTATTVAKSHRPWDASRSAADPPRISRVHEVGPGRIAPVVVHREDVRVFETGHDAGLDFETPDELGFVRDVRVDDLDRHVAVDARLTRPPDHTPGSRTDLLRELVRLDPWMTGRRGCQLGSVVQDLQLQFTHRRRWFEAELVGQHVAVLLAVPEGFGLPAGTVEGGDQLELELFTERVGGDEAFELDDRLAVSAGGDHRLDPNLVGDGCAAPPSGSDSIRAHSSSTNSA